MHSVLDTVRSFAEAHGLLSEKRVLVGISGGADSLVLSDILLRLGHTVSAVHVNYRLRGEDADEDEAHVRRWCEERGISLVARSFDTASLSAGSGKSIQETARDLRYNVFAEVAGESGIRIVTVGHHRDDQAETVLLNLFRGSGPEGLAGMPSARDLAPLVRLERPLLGLSRGEIEAYAAARAIQWREDQTNTKTVYRRGALRSEILPLIERHFGGAVTENIVRSAELVRAYVELSMTEEIREAFDSAVMHRDDNNSGALSVAVLSDLPRVMRGRVILEALRRWVPEHQSGFIAVGEVESLLSSQAGRRVQYGPAAVWRDRDCIRFVSRAPDDIMEPHGLEAGGSCMLPQGLMRAELVEHSPESLDEGPDVAYLDAGSLEEPLIVRRWRAGDRFRPLGMEQTKKLSDFLTDVRVPPHEKPQIHVVESAGKIIWVVGLRIADDFKVNPETKRIMRLSLARGETPYENTSPESE